jgi:hypothetical protein
LETLLPTSVKTINFNGTEPLVGEFLTPWLIKVMNTFLLCSLKTKQQIAHVGPTIIIYFFFPLCLTQLKEKNGKSIIQFSLDISSKSTHEHKRHNIVPSNKDICKIMQLSSNIRSHPIVRSKQSFACGNTCLLEENRCRLVLFWEKHFCENKIGSWYFLFQTFKNTQNDPE